MQGNDAHQDKDLTISQKVTQNILNSMQNSLTEIRRLRGQGVGATNNLGMIQDFFKQKDN